MKKAVLLCIISICSTLLLAQPHHSPNSILGEFVAYHEPYIIYKSNEYVASEYANYTLYTYNIVTKKKTQLDVLSINVSPTLQEDSIIYIKGNDIVKMNIITGEKSIYASYSNQVQLIGIGYNQMTNHLLCLLLDYKNNELNMKLYNDRKVIFFDESFPVNTVTMEAVAPIVYSTENWLVFDCIKDLIQIDCYELTFNYISQNSSTFALGRDEVVFYTYANNKNNGFTYNLASKDINAIGSDMNEQIKSCTNSQLYQSVINNTLYPTFTVCNVPYLWENGRWNEENAPILYENGEIQITLSNEMNVEEPTFFWKFK